MAAVSYAATRRALEHGDVAPVYYLTGDEDILKDELVTALMAAVVDPTTRDFNCDQRSAGDLDLEALFALVETPPMLAERRFAVVRGLEQWRKGSKVWKGLLEYVAQPSPSTVLVLVHSAGQEVDAKLAGACTHVAVPRPDHDTMCEWAVARAARRGIRLRPDAASHLVTAVGTSLSLAALEIDKVAAAADEGAEVAVEDVERFVGIRHGETIEDWVDAVVRRDIPRAVRLLDVVLPQPGMTAVRMVMTLGTTLVATRMTRALLDEGRTERQAIDALWKYVKKVRPRGIGRYGEEIQRWVAAARRWTGPELAAAVATLYEADARLKSTTISDPRATLTTALLGFTRREAA